MEIRKSRRDARRKVLLGLLDFRVRDFDRIVSLLDLPDEFVLGAEDENFVGFRIAVDNIVLIVDRPAGNGEEWVKGGHLWGGRPRQFDDEIHVRIKFLEGVG